MERRRSSPKGLRTLQNPSDSFPLQLLIFSTLFLSSAARNVSLNGVDGVALLLFRSRLTDPDRALSSWLGPNCSTWAGVACEPRAGHVVALNLTLLNLSGEIHPSLCSLSLLNRLVLSGNGFNGSVPACFGSLVSLEVLDVSRNRFTSDVPGKFQKLKNLKEFGLSGNSDLGGGIPDWIGNFSNKLEKIDLSFCSFAEEVPLSLFDSRSIRDINLEDNLLTGDIYASSVLIA